MTDGRSEFLSFSPEVAEARRSGRPVVAIESSIVSPTGEFPANVTLLTEVTATLRARGVAPAVIAAADRRVFIGLDEPGLQRFAQERQVVKAGRRDLASVLARGETASTTVSSALYCAQLANLPLVMTGAIGGVHRGYEETLDVSTDLEQLAISPVAVVCAGAKVILDLPRTLEYLETKGVPVLGYRTSDFPAYFCSSGLSLDTKFDNAAEIAATMRTHWSLGMSGGLVIAVAPSADIAMDRATIEGHVVTSLAEASRKGITGKAITPFLLRHLEQATGRLSERVRRAAVLRVAEAAAEIAVEYASHDRGVARPRAFAAGWP